MTSFNKVDEFLKNNSIDDTNCIIPGYIEENEPEEKYRNEVHNLVNSGISQNETNVFQGFSNDPEHDASTREDIHKSISEENTFSDKELEDKSLMNHDLSALHCTNQEAQTNEEAVNYGEIYCNEIKNKTEQLNNSSLNNKYNCNASCESNSEKTVFQKLNLCHEYIKENSISDNKYILSHNQINSNEELFMEDLSVHINKMGCVPMTNTKYNEKTHEENKVKKEDMSEKQNYGNKKDRSISPNGCNISEDYLVDKIVLGPTLINSEHMESISNNLDDTANKKISSLEKAREMEIVSENKINELDDLDSSLMEYALLNYSLTFHCNRECSPVHNDMEDCIMKPCHESLTKMINITDEINDNETIETTYEEIKFGNQNKSTINDKIEQPNIANGEFIDKPPENKLNHTGNSILEKPVNGSGYSCQNHNEEFSIDDKSQKVVISLENKTDKLEYFEKIIIEDDIINFSPNEENFNCAFNYIEDKSNNNQHNCTVFKDNSGHSQDNQSVFNKLDKPINIFSDDSIPISPEKLKIEEKLYDNGLVGLKVQTSQNFKIMEEDLNKIECSKTVLTNEKVVNDENTEKACLTGDTKNNNKSHTNVSNNTCHDISDSNNSNCINTHNFNDSSNVICNTIHNSNANIEINTKDSKRFNKICDSSYTKYNTIRYLNNIENDTKESTINNDKYYAKLNVINEITGYGCSRNLDNNDTLLDLPYCDVKNTYGSASKFSDSIYQKFNSPRNGKCKESKNKGIAKNNVTKFVKTETITKKEQEISKCEVQINIIQQKDIQPNTKPIDTNLKKPVDGEHLKTKIKLPKTQIKTNGIGNRNKKDLINKNEKQKNLSSLGSNQQASVEITKNKHSEFPKTSSSNARSNQNSKRRYRGELCNAEKKRKMDRDANPLLDMDLNEATDVRNRKWSTHQYSTPQERFEYVLKTWNVRVPSDPHKNLSRHCTRFPERDFSSNRAPGHSHSKFFRYSVIYEQSEKQLKEELNNINIELDKLYRSKRRYNRETVNRRINEMTKKRSVCQSRCDKLANSRKEMGLFLSFYRNERFDANLMSAEVCRDAQRQREAIKFIRTFYGQAKK